MKRGKIEIACKVTKSIVEKRKEVIPIVTLLFKVIRVTFFVVLFWTIMDNVSFHLLFFLITSLLIFFYQ